MHRSYFMALAALIGATALGGCVTESSPPTYAYSNPYPYGYYSTGYPVSRTYPNGYTSAYSPDYNGSYNTYDTAGGHGR